MHTMRTYTKQRTVPFARTKAGRGRRGSIWPRVEVRVCDCDPVITTRAARVGAREHSRAAQCAATCAAICHALLLLYGIGIREITASAGQRRERHEL